MMTKSYSKLILFENFSERLSYLSLKGKVSDITFGGNRYLNQFLYKCEEWKKVRREIILRDNGFDLAHEGYPINGNIYVHHINPITAEDIVKKRSCVFDSENLISCSFQTHNLIHYGVEECVKNYEQELSFKERGRYDTCPWRL